jgi:hypothetical protein
MQEDEMAHERRSNKSRTLPGITPSGESLIGSKASQVKAALIAAKNLAVSQEALREQTALLPAGLAQRSPILQANQWTAERLLISLFEKSGFDFDKFEEIQAQNRAESSRILEAQQAEAVKRSAEAKATFHSAVDSRRKIIEQLVASTGTAANVQTSQVVLNEPFMISTYPTPAPDLSFDEYHIEPWNSWAKFTIDPTASGGNDYVNFYFSWENSSDQYAVIDVDTWLMLSGSCKVDIPGHWFDTEKAVINIHAELGILEWWNQPPTVPPLSEADQIQPALYLPLEKGVLGGFISPQSKPVFRTYDLRYNFELVPPGGTVVIVVGPAIAWANENGGGIEADFDTGDVQIMCPFVQLHITPFTFPQTGGWTVQ